MLSIQLKVNGTLHAVQIEPAETLLHVLREKLGLTGTKEGCGEGDCGACTILVDGKSVNSCIFPAVQADGCEILTVEGVENDPKLAAIQKAFVDNVKVKQSDSLKSFNQNRGLLDSSWHVEAINRERS